MLHLRTKHIAYIHKALLLLVVVAFVDVLVGFFNQA
ncbi:hypothetical protein C8U37_10475 [Trichococcus patagoniensis]|uniref:Uncharacterized protein n=1 Tax=Trichococcus patagoniensis TaxID=382641 RepID=A0A2T5INN5_9LACT|nr:hypothetical protein C8U37_10475 [Trichococcus patagoniensis]